MALNTLKCKQSTPLGLKGLTPIVSFRSVVVS